MPMISIFLWFEACYKHSGKIGLIFFILKHDYYICQLVCNFFIISCFYVKKSMILFFSNVFAYYICEQNTPQCLTPLEERINIFESLFRYSKLHNFFYKNQ